MEDGAPISYIILLCRVNHLLFVSGKSFVVMVGKHFGHLARECRFWPPPYTLSKR